VRFANTQLFLLLGLALIWCSAGAANGAPNDTTAACSQPQNCICEQKPAPKRKPIIHTTSKPSPQSNEVYVYCGDTSATQHSTSSPTNGKGVLPELENSIVKTADKGKPDCPPTELSIDYNGIGVNVKSSNPYIFFPTLIITVLILFLLIWYASKQVKELAGKGNKDLTGFVWLGWTVAIGGLLAIAYVIFLYATQPSPEEYRDKIKEAISAEGLEEKLGRKVDTQLRSELQQCTVALQQGEIRIHRLEATTEIWPFTRGMPYLLFGAAVGLIVGMLTFIPLDVLLSVRRRRYSSDPDLDALLDELQKELVSKEKETMREILRRLREKPTSDKSDEP
jgi:hypothetical protein